MELTWEIPTLPQASLFSGVKDLELELCLGPAEDRNPKAPGRVTQSLVLLERGWFKGVSDQLGGESACS